MALTMCPPVRIEYRNGGSWVRTVYDQTCKNSTGYKYNIDRLNEMLDQIEEKVRANPHLSVAQKEEICMKLDNYKSSQRHLQFSIRNIHAGTSKSQVKWFKQIMEGFYTGARPVEDTSNKSFVTAVLNYEESGIFGADSNHIHLMFYTTAT